MRAAGVRTLDVDDNVPADRRADPFPPLVRFAQTSKATVIDVVPSVVFAEAFRLSRQGGPVRRFLATVRESRTAVSSVRGAVGQLRDTGPPPPWQVRPVTAVYRARSGAGHTLVQLTDTGRQLLSSHVEAKPGAAVMVDVWLTSSGGENAAIEVRVHVGATEVGALDTDATAGFLPDITAASTLYDEQVQTSGLAIASRDGTVRLQLRQPPN